MQLEEAPSTAFWSLHCVSNPRKKTNQKQNTEALGDPSLTQTKVFFFFLLKPKLKSKVES